MKQVTFVVALLAVVTLAACDKENSPTAPSSTSQQPTAQAPVAAPPAFNYTDGVEIAFGRTANVNTKFSARATGNLNAMLESRITDFNGAEMDMYVYAANGNRRKWTTAYANSVYNGRASTIWRDVDTDNAVNVALQVYPFRSDTPVRATFPTDYRAYQRLTEGINFRHNATDGLMHLQGPLPPVSATFSLNTNVSGILRIEDATVAPARLTEVVNADGKVLCNTEQTCRGQ